VQPSPPGRRLRRELQGGGWLPGDGESRFAFLFSKTRMGLPLQEKHTPGLRRKTEKAAHEKGKAGTGSEQVGRSVSQSVRNGGARKGQGRHRQ
jgi:hypothetical protein